MSYLKRIERSIEDLTRWKINRARKRLNNKSLDYAIDVLGEAKKIEESRLAELCAYTPECRTNDKGLVGIDPEGE